MSNDTRTFKTTFVFMVDSEFENSATNAVYNKIPWGEMRYGGVSLVSCRSEQMPDDKREIQHLKIRLQEEEAARARAERELVDLKIIDKHTMRLRERLKRRKLLFGSSRSIIRCRDGWYICTDCDAFATSLASIEHYPGCHA